MFTVTYCSFFLLCTLRFDLYSFDFVVDLNWINYNVSMKEKINVLPENSDK